MESPTSTTAQLRPISPRPPRNETATGFDTTNFRAREQQRCWIQTPEPTPYRAHCPLHTSRRGRRPYRGCRSGCGRASRSLKGQASYRPTTSTSARYRTHATRTHHAGTDTDTNTDVNTERQHRPDTDTDTDVNTDVNTERQHRPCYRLSGRDVRGVKAPPWHDPPARPARAPLADGTGPLTTRAPASWPCSEPGSEPHRNRRSRSWRSGSH